MLDQLTDGADVEPPAPPAPLQDDRQDCKHTCGRPVAWGKTTCCRACARSHGGGDHDGSCCVRGCRQVCDEGSRCRQRNDATHMELQSHPLDADYEASCLHFGKEPEPRSLKMVFDWADSDRSGKLSRAELQANLEVMEGICGQRFPRITDKVWKKIDEDGNGVVNFSEFASWAGPRLGLPLGLQLLAQRSTVSGSRGSSSLLDVAGAGSRPCGVMGCPCEAFVPERTGKTCPNCDYGVTWHATHCCQACKRRPGKHGNRCERKSPHDAASTRCKTCKHKRQTHVAKARTGEVEYPAYWSRHSGKFQHFVDMPSMGEFQGLIDATYKTTWTRDRKKHNPDNTRVPRAFKVIRVQRNENSHGWREYFARRTELVTRCSEGDDLHLINDVKTAAPLRAGSMGDRLLTPCNEWYLFHGTNPEAAKSICASDFKVSCAGRNTGTLYGRGLYFAESITKADEYAKPNDFGICAVLLCRVLGGNVLYVDDVNPDPDELVSMCVEGPYDCVLGDREKTRWTYREFVIFDSEDCYPEYIIEYSRVY